VPDAAAAAELMGALLREGDTVLVKGSRAVGLERVVERLRGAARPAREPAGPPPSGCAPPRDPSERPAPTLGAASEQR
jgi:hypothetical protein